MPVDRTASIDSGVRPLAVAAAAAAHPTLNRRPPAACPPPASPPQLMGLQDVQLAQQPAVEEAYTALMEAPLEEGYRCGAAALWCLGPADRTSAGLGQGAGEPRPLPPTRPIPPHPYQPPLRSELARLGKEKLLFAAREGLREVRGRTSVLEKTLQIEPLLLPGAMALLHQVCVRCTAWEQGRRGRALRARRLAG